MKRYLLSSFEKFLIFCVAEVFGISSFCFKKSFEKELKRYFNLFTKNLVILTGKPVILLMFCYISPYIIEYCDKELC